MLGVSLPASFFVPAAASGAETVVVPGAIMPVTDQSDLGAVDDTTRVESGGTLDVSGDVVVEQGLYTLSGDGVGGVGALRSTGNNTLSGDIRFEASTKITSDAGVLELDGDMSSAVLHDLDVTFDGNGNILYSGNMNLGAPGQSYGFFKEGSGTLTFTGTDNFYTGTLAVSGGTLEVSNGGAFTAISSASGDSVFLDGNLVVTGTGSSFTAQNSAAGHLNYLVVGRENHPLASVTVKDGARLTTGATSFGEGNGFANTTDIVGEVEGTGSIWDYGSSFTMGSAPGGTALLTISDGGLVTGGMSSFGRGGESTVIVTDAGSRLSSTWSMKVGELFGDHAGDGTLVIENGGLASAGNTYIGVGSSGAVTVRAGSELQAGTSLRIGEDTLSYTSISAAGDGALTIEAGGLAVADAVLLGLNNGHAAGSSGTVTVLGSAASRGVLETRSLMKGDETATALFDGGILRATGNDTTDNPFLGSMLGAFTVNIGDDGMYIDTQAYDVTAAAVLADDDPLAPGSLTKQGTGTLTLTEANSYSGDTLVAAGILRAGAAGTFSAASGAAVAAGAAMDLAGFDQTIASLDNTGLVATNGAGPGTVLTVTGNYTGNDGILALNTSLGGDLSPTDLLHVQGDTFGTGLLRITNTGGPGAQTVEGIKVIDVDGASGATFTLTNPDYIFEGDPAMVAGAYGYRLYKNGIATPADGDWYLRSALLQAGPGTPPSGPLYQPGAPLYEAFADVLQGFNGIETMQQRLGNRVWDAGIVDRGQTSAGTDDGSGTWARVAGRHTQISPVTTTTGSRYGADIWQLQAGGDGLIHADEAGRLNGGVWGRYGTVWAEVGSRHGEGSIAATGYGVGGSLTWQGDAGVYLDAQAQLTWYDSGLHSRTAATDLAAGIGGFGYSAGLEAGQRIALGTDWSLTPQAQLVYSQVNYDDFTDAFGAGVSLLDGRSLRGRIGISADYENSWVDDAGEVSRVHAYGIANLHYDFLSGSETDLAGVRFASDPGALWGGIGLGGTYNWGDDQYALHAEAALNTALGNFGDSYEVTATLGFNVKF